MAVMHAFRKPRFGKKITVPTANVVTLISLLPAALRGLVGVHRITLHNISENNIEVGIPDEAGDAPVTTAMDILEPGDSISIEWEGNDLKTIYVKADDADSSAYAWGEGK